MNPIAVRITFILAAVACFVAAFFLEDQRTILVAAGVGSLALLAPQVGKSKKAKVPPIAGAAFMAFGAIAIIAGNLTLMGCSPAATQAIVSAASSVLSEILLRSQQKSEVLDMVEARADSLQLPPEVDKRVRSGIAACRAANAAALAAAQGADQTAASANAAFEPFRREWAALAQILEQVGVLSPDGAFKAVPGEVAIPQPLALEPIQ